jgi:CubicO group peptidase (beta-lactamase class C family)
VFWSRVFGVRNILTGEIVTEDTLFEAASLSKPVFAYAVLKLCQQGSLELDTPLNDYMPEPYLPDEQQSKLITLRHVLSHTTGFPNWRSKGKSLKMMFSPGERFSYSGEGYIYLQTVVAHLLGQQLAEWMRMNLLKPLGLQHSFFTWTAEDHHSTATGHDGKGQPTKKRSWSKMSAASSLHTTSIDFARFMCLVMQSASDNPAFIGPEMAIQMLTPQVQVFDSSPEPKHNSDKRKGICLRTNPNVGWGLGWGIQQTTSGDSFWHWGDNGDFRAYAEGNLKTGHGIAIMSNAKNGQKVIDSVLYAIIGGEHPGLNWLRNLY